ncbi:MAG: hypothetical protein HC799_16195 [Limnothrix sp. RL_2_0]|nr:hypothetical protein [Limnothrix sp. RL_2_0]
MALTPEQGFGAGGGISGSIVSIDFAAAGRENYGLDDPANITTEQAIAILQNHFATLTAQNDDPTSSIGAATTTTAPSFITTRGGTTVTHKRKSITLYQFYQSTDETTDVDNLVG